MKDGYTIEGRWHIFGPSQPAHYGTLSLEPDSRLTLDVKIPRGPEDTSKRKPFGEFICLENIHGFNSQGEPISLFACMGEQPIFSDSLDSYRIYPIVGVLGHHFDSWEQINSRCAQANYSLLDEWLRRSTIKAHPEAECTTFTQRSIPAIAIPLSNGEEIVLTCGYSQEIGIGELNLSQLHTVHFNFTKPKSLSEIRSRYIHVFRQLLTFLAGSEVFIDKVKFSNGGLCDNEILSRKENIAPTRRKLSYGRMLVDYREIANSFPGIVSRWFDYHSRMEPILNLYFTACWNQEMPGTTKFLLLAQSLEAYHSRSPQYDSAVQSREDFRSRVKTLLSNISDENEKKWLQEKLQHANRKTLAQRLNELIGTQQKAVAQFISDPIQFATTIRHTRNYFTHFDEKLPRRGKLPHLTELSKLTIQMRALLEICFLRDLDLPEPSIQRVVARSKNVRFISLESSPAIT